MKRLKEKITYFCIGAGFTIMTIGGYSTYQKHKTEKETEELLKRYYPLREEYLREKGCIPHIIKI